MAKKNIKSKLSPMEQGLLEMIPRFPRLDKSSQVRYRRLINERRKQNPAFEEAFGGALYGRVYREPQERRIGESFLRTLNDFKDVVTHPIIAAKGKVGEVLLKNRNKAPEILVHPNPMLTEMAEAWDFQSGDKGELISIVRQLGAALRGVDYGDRLGLAAPQIGISKRVFVCQGAVCVNPSYELPRSGAEYEEFFEGCYSIPNKEVWKTKRAKRIFAKWYSVDGILREYMLKGRDAIVFQHELDHLDGKCACDIGVLYTPEEHAKTVA